MVSENLDYLKVLKALEDIPFSVGKKLLVDYLRGCEDNESIMRNGLFHKKTFGSLAYDEEELGGLIDSLLMNDLVRYTSFNGNKFWKVIELTPKGRTELENPALYKKKVSFSYKDKITTITDEDRINFMQYQELLNNYNEEQKKAIISKSNHILCIAGAGSGKTTVLTKRIEYLVKYQSVHPKRILAITFTRKARQEMSHRLSRSSMLESVHVETFNSFCEKILKHHNDLIYNREVRVLEYRDKLMIMSKALSILNTNMERAVDIYFTTAQKRGKTPEQLANIFINDCFFIRDYMKFKHKSLENEIDLTDKSKHYSAKLVVDVCKYIEKYMQMHGLRDYADQLLDAIELFGKHPGLIPQFDHILVDEYQDVNSTQIKLLDMLNPKNLFCVGDPRQSIYGWRGSDIRYLLKFEEKYADAQTITLTENYRSTKHIVDLINRSISSMHLPDLKSSIDSKKDIKLLKFNSEEAEYEFVIQRIISSNIARKEVFVLARTNRQLAELSALMKARGIAHIVRSDELKKSVVASENDVTLATIHAIKGLEAEMVFVIGCNNNNFPCKGSEHPVIEMIKVEEYDKEEEERRLFYVAMSRAKKTLYLTYCGTKTHYITGNMLEIIETKENNITKELLRQDEIISPPRSFKEQYKVSGKASLVIARLKEWRNSLSRQQNIPPYMILHDKTIIDIAARLPQSTLELQEVYGLGPTKIHKYGEEIIDIVNS